MLSITTTTVKKYCLAIFTFCLVQFSYAATFIVSNTGDAGAGSLRQAIIDANTAAGADNISFAIAGAGPHTIALTSALPAISSPITLDGYTQTGAVAGGLRIIVNGNNVVGNCFDINTLGPSTIRGIAINNFTAFPIFINGINGNTITGNYIGINVAGTAAAANGFNGITIVNSDNNIIGGIAAIDRNIISGNNQHGINIESGSNNNTILGNYIGVSAAGIADVGNGLHGINVDNSPGNTIDRNVISGNGINGINITNNSGTTTITGNTVGLNSAGTAIIRNDQNGVSIFMNSTNCSVTNNILSGNQANGLNIDNASGGAIITGNKIGTNDLGSAALANSQNGIFINNSLGCTIGGSALALRNIISGNIGSGLFALNSNMLTIKANYIGLDATGLLAMGNQSFGLLLENCDDAVIGNNNANERNYISANNNHGVILINNSDNNTIQGNYIGTDNTGNSALPNYNHGIHIDGGTATCDNINIVNNVISGNGHFSGTLPSPPATPTYFATGNGINIVNFCTGIVIQGNIIGLGANGTTALGNKENGITLADIPNATIGGDRSNANERNIICNQAFHGIVLYQSNNATVRGNIIGTDATLSLDRGNQDSGIITINVTSGTIGGMGANDGNIFVNSKEEYGIRLQVSFNVTMKGNYIGTNTTTTTDMGNILGGIYLMDYAGGCNNNIIGASGTTPVAGEANIIAYNKGPGVILEAFVSVARFNPIRGNSIYCNTGKGISLLSNGNGNKAAPVINNTPDANTVSGTAAANDIIHIYRNPTTDCGTCQGKIYVGNTTANASGIWSFTHGLGLTLAEIVLVTATATDATNNTSEFASCMVLPVEYASISVTKAGEYSALVSWQTATETNNHYFVVEHSLDGVNWIAIGTVQGAGNSNNMLSYSYTDTEASLGVNYYRIKQVDFDGKYGYSLVKTISFSGEFDFTIYPNPATQGFTVAIYQFGHSYTMELVNALGQTVTEVNSDELTYTMDSVELAKGIYYITIQTEEGAKKTQRLLIQ